MGTRASLTPIYGKNAIGERVIIKYKNAGRTESQKLAGKYPKVEVQKAKDKGNTAKSLKIESPKIEVTIPKKKFTPKKRR